MNNRPLLGDRQNPSLKIFLALGRLYSQAKNKSHGEVSLESRGAHPGPRNGGSRATRRRIGNLCYDS